MSEDIFEFWSRCAPAAHVHPDDETVLSRVEHGFDLRCLPGPFTGPLKSAPVVLLFIAPGFEPFDVAHAQSDAGQSWYAEQRKGTAPLPSPAEHPTHYRWWTRIVRQFGVGEAAARTGMAVLDMAPYHSSRFRDGALLSALPSCRKSVEWAQEVLFPEAIAGRRAVICLRAAAPWGLRTGAVHGEALFCPAFNRGGVMLHGDLRNRIAAEVRTRIGG
ncbi:MAG TPA: hypothetical protein VFW19_17825 [Allosphingosinicella sp.]|nr:hypothetical protein [Allosphingosinicella sp.]